VCVQVELQRVVNLLVVSLVAEALYLYDWLMILKIWMDAVKDKINYFY